MYSYTIVFIVGAAGERVMWAPSEEMAELFLECDDPLAAEEWDMS